MKFNYSKMLNLAITIVAILSIAVIVIGTLAIPVVLSVIFSWYWMFLYIGYLLAVLFIALYIAADNGRTRK